MYLCLCKGIRECDLKEVARGRCLAAQHLIRTFGLDDDECCGRCAENVQQWVAIARAQPEQKPL
jgi:bacterioferritin-associated ferredoxin